MARSSETSWGWRSPSGIALFVFLAIAAFFLFTEHTAHIIPVLPWLLLLACPFIHMFMHRGHGSHGNNGGHEGHKGHENHTKGEQK